MADYLTSKALTRLDIIDGGGFAVGPDDLVLDGLGELDVVLLVEGHLTLKEGTEGPETRVRCSPWT